MPANRKIKAQLLLVVLLSMAAGPVLAQDYSSLIGKWQGEDTLITVYSVNSSAAGPNGSFKMIKDRFTVTINIQHFDGDSCTGIFLEQRNRNPKRNFTTGLFHGKIKDGYLYIYESDPIKARNSAGWEYKWDKDSYLMLQPQQKDGKLFLVGSSNEGRPLSLRQVY